MACFAGDAEFESLDFEVAHEFCDAFGDGAKVVVLHLLVLGGIVSHEGTSGQQEVGACGIESLIDEEVFLFPAEVGGDASDVGVKVFADGSGSLIDCGECFFERRLIVESFSGVTDEDGGNHQCVADEEDGRGRVPGGVAACLEGGADAAVGEGGGVGLLLHEFFSGEFFNHAAFEVVFHEGVVFFGCSFGQWLEPVCAVGGSHFHCPLLHSLCHVVGDAQGKHSAFLDDLAQLLIGLEGEILEHFLLVEHILAKVL